MVGYVAFLQTDDEHPIELLAFAGVCTEQVHAGTERSVVSPRTELIERRAHAGRLALQAQLVNGIFDLLDGLDVTGVDALKHLRPSLSYRGARRHSRDHSAQSLQDGGILDSQVPTATRDGRGSERCVDLF